MAEFTGAVRCLLVTELSAFTTLDDGAGASQTFILWFNPGGGSGIPPQIDAFTRVLHSMWISLLREARSSGDSITIDHPTNGAEVIAVQLG